MYTQLLQHKSYMTTCQAVVAGDLQPQSMSPAEVRLSRKCAITQVLGTDMKKHFDILTRFQVCIVVWPDLLHAVSIV